MKRKERRHLKANEFAEFTRKVIRFIGDHSRAIAIGAAVIAAAVLIVLGLRFIQSKNLEKQSRILAQINQVSRELREDPQKMEELKDLAGQGKFDRSGHIHIAAYHIENGDYEKALEAVEKIPQKPKDIIYYQSREIKALALWKQKKYEDALEVFEAIEKEDPKGYAMDGILFQKAEILKEMGRTDEAVEVLQKITREYSRTYYAMEAEQELGRLQ